MKKKISNKLILSFVIFSLLLSVTPNLARAVLPEELPDSGADKVDTDACEGIVKTILKTAVGSVIPTNVSTLDAVPVSDKEAQDILKQTKVLACESKKNTEAIRKKTVGSYIFGIPCPFCSWDAIRKIAMKAVIKKLTDDTINWINTGANGNPMFVTDPGQYFTNVANGLADDFILGTNSPLNFLCTPFAQNIKLSLRSNYATRQSYNPQCTFTGIAGFLKDGFNRGGWQDWFSLTQNPTNNPYESYLNAQVELDSRIQSALKIKQDQLNWGSGFLSAEKCDEDTGKCQIVTPGSVIGPQLNKVLGLGADDLTLARSFDDVVSALVGFLTKKIFSPGGGLLSANSKDTGSDDGIETGTGLTPGPQDFGPGVDPTSGVTCAPDKTNALFNDPVTWTTTAVEAGGISYSYEWSGTDVPAGSTDSVLVMNYSREYNMVASVKITSTRASNVSEIPIVRTSTINCSPAVKVAKFAPLVINSCGPDKGSEQAVANEIAPFKIDTAANNQTVLMARVTWIANISGGSGVLATNNSIVWNGETRDDTYVIIQTRRFGSSHDKYSVSLWNPNDVWNSGSNGDGHWSGGSSGARQTITKLADGTTQIKMSRLYQLIADGKETDRYVSAKITVRDINPFIANDGKASRDCKPEVFIYKPR